MEALRQMILSQGKGIGSDIAPQYAGIDDGTPVTRMQYIC